MNNDWTEFEVELIIADYFAMLILELHGQKYNKAFHRKNLMPFLNGRSDGSVEFKHQNISAVLIGLGVPYIKGYKPRFNFQRALLTNKVVEYLNNHLELASTFSEFAENSSIENSSVDFAKWVLPTPVLQQQNSQNKNYGGLSVKINYLEREERNQKLGFQGEELAFTYERFLLTSQGLEKYVDSIEWVSKERGDGMGFDILSRNMNGTDKYIEVKTTKLGREAPFFFSSNEYLFSLSNRKNYHLYRIFDVGNQPKVYKHHGSFDDLCLIEPVQYKGSF